jgi:small ligand-binding sensory domain FIST
MKLFLHAHATHPEPHLALALAAAQIEAQRAQPESVDQPTLGWMYLTDHFADHAEGLLAEARERWPGVAWVGAVGVGVAGNGVEYFGEPAISLMLGDPPRGSFRVFSGQAPLGDFEAAVAQVHADPRTADLAELVGEMAGRTASGYLFGGLACGHGRTPHIADGVFDGGLSGVAFGPEVPLLSRVTQGCQPVGAVRRITAGDGNVVLSLDDEPALESLLRDLKVTSGEIKQAVPALRRTLVGLSDDGDRTLSRPGQFGHDTRVRHLIGIDPGRRGVAIADRAEVGLQLAFCKRDAEAAQRDLVRICAEIREEIEPEALPLETALALQGREQGGTPHPARRVSGAVYVSCSGRGGPHFGAPHAELATLRHALGDVPLVGFFAGGEIARRHLYGYTGVLTVFVHEELS